MKQAYFVGYDAVGDYLSNCGFIRHLTKFYDQIYVPSDLCEYLQLLFNDNQKVIPISHPTFFDMVDQKQKIDCFDVQIWPTIKNSHTKHIGPHLFNGNFFNTNNKFGKFLQDVDDNGSSFYSHLGMNIDIRINEFHYNRDLEKEKKLFDGLNLKDKNYAVIVEYDNIKLNRDLIKCETTINLHNLAPSILDLITIIENANEVHLIDNSIALMVYHLQYKKLMKNNTINFHTYPRQRGDFINNMMRRPQLDNWNFI